MRESKSIQHASILSESLMQLLLERFHQAVMIIHEEKVVYASHSLEVIIEIPHEEMIDSDIRLIADLLHPEDGQSLIRLFQSLANRETGAREMDIRIVSDFGVKIVQLLADSVKYNDEVVIGVLFIDVSDLRQREQILIESESHYRSLFEDSPVSMWEEDFSEVKKYLDVLTEEGVSDFSSYFEENPQSVGQCAALVRPIRVNKATLELHGVESEEVLLGGMGRVFSENAINLFKQQLLHLLEGDYTFQNEASLLTMGGDVRNFMQQVTIPEGYRDSWSRVLVSMFDITERIQAEETLALERKTFRIIAEATVRAKDIKDLCQAILEGMIETLGFDIGTVRLYDKTSNSLKLIAFFGIEKDKLRPDVECNDETYLVARVARTIDPIFAPNVSVSEEIQTQRTRIDELQIQSLIFWPLLDSNQDVIGILNIAAKKPMDIPESSREFFENAANLLSAAIVRKQTEIELRNSEERFFRFADQLPGPMYIKDHESKVIFVNRYMKGMPSTDDWVGRDNYDLFADNVAKNLTEEDKRVLSEGPIVVTHEIELADGEARIFRAYKFPIEREGKPPLIGGFSLDITEQEQSRKVAIDAKARTSLAFDLMTHDLTNIHQGAMASLELLLLKGNLPEEARENAVDALSEIKRGVKLIDNVAKLSTVIESEPELDAIDLFELIQTVLSRIEREFPGWNILVNGNLDAFRVSVFADKYLMDVLYNILNNAVKFSPRERAQIELSCIQKEDTDVEIRIADHGKGIKDDAKEKVLSRLDSLTRGTGIGLTLVSEIVSRYNGSIMIKDRVEGDYTKGVEFIICLQKA